ncbi:MAG TPA: zinc ribbon domain-containing protein [Ktedonobacteraceae bacterium]|nr:zinc ribbon domain-containing protein [Ktedonobacteraceae bacterium]
MIGIVPAFLLSCLTVYADSTPGGNVADPSVRAADVAGPAVVRIITTIKGHLTVHFPPTTQVTFPQLDNGSYSLQISGTGTFITSHGDILASDHVVNPPKDKTLDEMLYNAAAQDVANYINQNAKQGSSQVTKDDVIQQLSSGQPSSTTSYDTATSVVYLSTSYTGPLAVPDLKSLPTGVTWQVDQIKKESTLDQQDLAIVHVPMQDAPSVQLADSSKIQAQGNFTMISFPGNVDVSQQPNDFLTTSVNVISADAKQTSATATPPVQGGGNVDNGNRSSLVLDSQGNIVGIISSPNNSGSSTFLQENNNQRTMLSSVNLDTTPGQFQQLWSQAFQDYVSTTPSHWQKAQDDFNQLQANYPNFKAAQPYLNYAREQAQRELATPTSTVQLATPTAQTHQSNHTRPRATPASFPSAQVLTVTAIVLLLGLVVLLFTVIAGRAKKGRLANVRSAAVPIGERRKDGGESRANSQPSQVSSGLPQPPDLSGGSSAQSTLVLKIWSCGHMNRPGARFCSVCGEAAPDGT